MIALTSPFANALAWALVHFLWQGAAIALVVFALWRLFRLTAAARYQIGVAALATMLLAPVATTAWLMDRQARPAVSGAIAIGAGEVSSGTSTFAAPPAAPGTSDGAPARSIASRAGLLAVLVVWLSGVTMLSIRLLGGWIVARRLVHRNVGPVPHAIEVLARRVAARLAVDRVVRVLESSAVSVPMMVGWAKPVVLMPAAALAGLSPVQIEALIAHELAHVRRLDYLVNLIQSAVETLLFYHPAVWWLSREIRVEREHCCDDLAVDVCDRVEYVTALTTLASMATPRLALAATDGSLVRRVRRLLGPGTPEQGSASGWVAAMLGLAILVAAPVALTTARESGAGGASDAIVSSLPQAPAAQEVRPEPAQKAAPADVPMEVSPQAIAQQYEREASRAGELARQQRELEAAATARLQQAAEALRRLEKDRVALERTAIDQETVSRVQNVERELTEQERELARVRRSFEVGLAGRDAVQEAEARMVATRQLIVDLKAAHARRQQELGLEQRRLDLERERQVALEALEQVRQSTPNGLSESQAAQQQRVALMEKVFARLAQLQDADRLTTVTDPAATARAGDIINVSIQGEPDLPPAYAVQDNGTIRLPLLDPIKVVGLTTTQIEAAIRQQLARVSTKGSLVVVIRRR